MSSPFSGPRWPDARQTLLLRAALLGPEQAAAALAKWRGSGGDLDTVDHVTYKILPALYRNLERHGIDDADIGRLKGIYRRTWYQNRVLLHHAAQAVSALETAGIRTATLKGAAVLQLHHRDLALRPMQDVDILVPQARANEAARVLATSGWSPDLRPGQTVESNLAALHAVPFVNSQGGAVDLHRFALEECCSRGADDELWAQSRPLAIDSTTTRAQSPADLLVHVCVHGSRGQPERVIHWILDAMAIITDKDTPLEWDRVLAGARERHVSLPLYWSLRYVRDEFGTPVPPSVLRCLRSIRPSWVERLDYRAQGSRTTVYWAVARDTTRFFRLSAGLPAHCRLVAFPVYLQHLWGLERSSRVPLEGLRRVGRRLRETRFRPWRSLKPRN